jgi:DNA-directed RNA polymerase specialized sigma24 family protein
VDAGQREQLQRAMTALAAGDRSAFQPVFSALWPLLRRFCERTLKDRDVAHDAAQTALMKLLLNATSFRVGHDVVAWALGFASFECLSVRNRTTRRREHADDRLLAAVPAGQPSPEDAAIQEDLHVAALRVVGTLRPQDVDTLNAAFTDARVVASNATSRKRLQRALERLRMAWRRTHGSDD